MKSQVFIPISILDPRDYTLITPCFLCIFIETGKLCRRCLKNYIFSVLNLNCLYEETYVMLENNINLTNVQIKFKKQSNEEEVYIQRPGRKDRSALGVS